VSAAVIAVLAPLAAAVWIVVVRRASPVLALLGAVASLAASWFALGSVFGGVRHEVSFEWLPGLPSLISVDPLSALLSTTVSGVGLLVLLYSIGYMAGDRDSARFYAAMSLFLAAMQALVVAGDWLLFLGAWELIGLASYLLIGHWHERAGVGGAASRAFLTTRGADIGLYLGVFLLVNETGSTVIGGTLGISDPTATVAGLLLLLAAAGKAAQVPFQGWLAAAMAGPTPVSALLHSATLVAAGVILLLRAFPLLPSGVLLVVGALGGLTAVVAGLTALAQNDLKRLLAASTSSQLGLMLVGLGAGSLAAATFHLAAHAAVKSTLFLATGVFQHQRGATELGRLRGVGREQNWAYAGFAVAGLALAGLPPLAGFWSKDAVLAASMQSAVPWLLVPLALAGSLLTAMYMARALRLLWQGEAAHAEMGGGEAVRERTREPVGHCGLDQGGQTAVSSRQVSSRQRGDRAQGQKPGDLAWMRAGIAVLALMAAVLGVLAGPLEELLGTELPESMSAVTFGIVATLLGLAAGWLLSPEQLLGGLRPVAQCGFRIAGGISGVSVKPALRLSRLTDWLGNRLHDVVALVGRRSLAAATLVSRTDELLHLIVERAATATLAVAGKVRAGDQEGIEVLIAVLARRTRELGRSARLLQSGLVHRELALTVGGVAGLLLVMVLVVLSV
jgi:NADH-quinone oxidoreductase subunit L